MGKVELDDPSKRDMKDYAYISHRARPGFWPQKGSVGGVPIRAMSNFYLIESMKLLIELGSEFIKSYEHASETEQGPFGRYSQKYRELHAELVRRNKENLSRSEQQNPDQLSPDKRVVKSQFQSTCFECGNRILIGQFIKPSYVFGGWVHMDCPENPDPYLDPGFICGFTEHDLL